MPCSLLPSIRNVDDCNYNYYATTGHKLRRRVIGGGGHGMFNNGCFPM